MKAWRCIASTILAMAIGSVSMARVGASPTPTLSLSSHALVSGHYVVISGSGWPADSALQATLCGSDAVDGSADCDSIDAVTFSPNTSGILSASLLVVVPPKPCPCVVLVESLDGYTKSFPVEIDGALSAPIVPITPSLAPGRLSISRVQVSGGMTLTSLFALPVRRVAVVTIHNSTTTRVRVPTLTASWGRAPRPANHITVRSQQSIGPGGTGTVRVPFSISPPAVGTYDVAVRLAGGHATLVAASTSTWPIGLLVLLAISVALWGFRFRKRPQHSAPGYAWIPLRPRPGVEPEHARVEFPDPIDETPTNEVGLRCERHHCSSDAAKAPKDEPSTFERILALGGSVITRDQELAAAQTRATSTDASRGRHAMAPGQRRGRLGP